MTVKKLLWINNPMILRQNRLSFSPVKMFPALRKGNPAGIIQPGNLC
jgi:hypothetical protein